MKSFVALLTLALVLISAGVVALRGQVASPPPWAYGFTAGGTEPAAPPCPKDARPLDCARIGAPRPRDVIHKLPETARTFAEYDIHFDYGPADWYPEDHPPMPDIVAHGREADRVSLRTRRSRASRPCTSFNSCRRSGTGRGAVRIREKPIRTR